MKKNFLIVPVWGALFLLISCDVRKKDKIAQNPSARQEEPVIKDSTSIQLIDTVYNFGNAKEGEIVEYNYRFKNIGSKPLIIVKASASCGCTVPEKPDQPILPGETGFIKVKFDSKGRVGHNDKKITVISNANPAFPDMMLTGEVLAAN